MKQLLNYCVLIRLKKTLDSERAKIAQNFLCRGQEREDVFHILGPQLPVIGGSIYAQCLLPLRAKMGQGVSLKKSEKNTFIS